MNTQATPVSSSATSPEAGTAADALSSMRTMCAPFFAQSAEINELQVRRNNLYEAAQAKLRKVQKMDGRLSKLYEKLSRMHPSNNARVLEPLAQALSGFFPGCTHEVGGPFGLGCTLYLTFRDPAKARPDDAVAYGNFRFDMEKMRLVLVDLSSTTDRFPPNSLGALNGLNHETIEITAGTNLAQIADKMRY